MKYITILLVVLCGLSPIVRGQLVTSSMSPAALIQNVLVGSGVKVSNVQFHGNSSAVGYFDAQNTNLGFKSGIVINTGTINNNGKGPQGPNNKSNGGLDNNGLTTYPPLQQLTNQSLYNIALLEFDFIPNSDTVRFRYIFGSEEYPEYVGKEFNDIFGFFISGPGISGQKNIALLPNGLPVAINNVNNGYNNNGSCMNCAYYVDNGNGNQSPYNSSPTYIQYDGYTKPLEAIAKVQCGQKYHIVLAIADVADAIFDSGIFLEANSLKTNQSFTIDKKIDLQPYTDPNQLPEGCDKVTFTINRTGKNLALDTIPIQVTGTATNCLDLTCLPPYIIMQPNQTTASISFTTLADNITEGIESLNVTFITKDACGKPFNFDFNFTIKEHDVLTLSVQDTTVICPGDTTCLKALVNGGVGPFSFTWNNGIKDSLNCVHPTTTTTYNVSILDNCLTASKTASGTVNVPVYGPIQILTQTAISEICPYKLDTLTATVSGGAGFYTYSWKMNNTKQLGHQLDQVVKTPATSTYTITVTDRCKVSASENILYTITSPPLVIQNSDTLICPLDTAKIFVIASGGWGNYHYLWKTTQDTNWFDFVHPGLTTNYEVSVWDDCKTFTVEGFSHVEVQKTTANFTTHSNTYFNNLPVTFENLTNNITSAYWTFGDGNNSTDINPSNTYLDPGTYLINLYIEDTLGCKDSTSRLVTIIEEYYVYIPNSFTPNEGNRLNNVFEASTYGVSSLGIKIFNRWGEIVYSSEQLDFKWDGTYQNVPVPIGTYEYEVIFLANNGLKNKILGHVNVIR